MRYLTKFPRRKVIFFYNLIDAFPFVGTRNFKDLLVLPAATTKLRNSTIITQTEIKPPKKHINKHQCKIEDHRRLNILMESKITTSSSKHSKEEIQLDLQNSPEQNTKLKQEVNTSQKKPINILETTAQRRIKVRRNSLFANEKTTENIGTLNNQKSQNYLVGEEIGKGGYATVRLAIHTPTLTRCALKMYEKASLTSIQRKNNITREINNLSKLSHSSIVKLVDSYETPTHINLALEYVDGVSLNTFLRNRMGKLLPETEVKYLFRQIVNGIAYCHEQFIVHGDIKLENIILSCKKEVKIIDFGFSTSIFGNVKSKLFCGTPSFMAPEILRRKEYEGRPADIWALGIVLYTLLCSCFPFRSSSREELFSSIISGIFKIPSHVSDKAQTLLKKMLSIDPNERPTASAILNDPWLSQ